MILKKGFASKYLEDVNAGRIKQGLDIGCALDNHLRFKRGTMNVVLGHDNVGKTAWIMWYFLCLSVKHGMKWCVWSGENEAHQLMRDLITMYKGQRVQDMNIADVYNYDQQISQWFDFISKDQSYTPKQLLTIFRESGADGCLIDPYTGLNRNMTYEGNYEFLNETREHCNKHKQTIYINTHSTSEANRSNRLYSGKHEWKGHLMAPMKAHAEGGQAFANRTDDFIILHRLIHHTGMKHTLMAHIAKVKDIESGGDPTFLNSPILCGYNSGLGFVIDGVNPLTGVMDAYNQTKQLAKHREEEEKKADEAQEKLDLEEDSGLPF